MKTWARWRWWQVLLALVALAGAGLGLDWALTPGPGTLLVREPAYGSYSRSGDHMRVVHSLGEDRGQPVLVRSNLAERRGEIDEFSVRRFVDGVALPVAVSPPAWEQRPSRAESFLIADGKLTVLEAHRDVFDAETDLPTPQGGRDCVTDMPLDGGPTMRRCHAPSLRVQPSVLVRARRVGADVYYAGNVLREHAVGLARIGGDGSWRVVDRIEVGEESEWAGGLVHDDDAVYWSTTHQVRRVGRTDGVVRTVLRSDLPLVQGLPVKLTMAGTALLALVFTRPTPRDNVTSLLLRLDPNREQTASQLEPLARFEEFCPDLAGDGRSVWVLGTSALRHVQLDGRTRTVAWFGGRVGQELTLAGDRVVYRTWNHQDEPKTVSLWSVQR